MLESLPASVMTHWLAYHRLQDPQHRSLVHWSTIEQQNPEDYKKQLAEAQRNILRGVKPSKR